MGPPNGAVYPIFAIIYQHVDINKFTYRFGVVACRLS